MSIVDNLIRDMIEGNVFASRNFSTREIAHQPIDVDPDKGYLFEAAHFQMGCMQMIRDYLTNFFHKDVPIKITSGYRHPAHNRLEGGVANSFHLWRIGVPNRLGLPLITACDFIPMGVDLKRAFEALSWLRGECYLNTPQGVIHYSPYGDEPHWVKEA